MEIQLNPGQRGSNLVQMLIIFNARLKVIHVVQGHHLIFNDHRFRYKPRVAEDHIVGLERADNHPEDRVDHQQPQGDDEQMSQRMAYNGAGFHIIPRSHMTPTSLMI